MAKNNIIDLQKAKEEIVEGIRKSKSFSVPSWSDLQKEYDPKQHEIVTNKERRPDKIKRGRKEDVARITYGKQKLATRRMTQFAFTIPVVRTYNIGDDPVKKAQAEAIEKVYEEARINSMNMKRMHAYFAACEICTLWYAVKGDVHDMYGFSTPFELKCITYSPMSKKFSKLEEAKIYPIKDKGGMQSISLEYQVQEDDKTVTYFETYTSMYHLIWKQVDGKWIDAEPPTRIAIQKIPLDYLWRPVPIWEDITGNNEEIEFALSRQSDIIRKNSAPMVKITGKLANGQKPQSDVAREVYQLENGGDVDYVTWQQQVEAHKFLVETLKNQQDEELQLPNLSLENVKGLGVQSGEARKTLLTDGHLKVGEESGDIIEFLEREFNIIREFVARMNVEWKSSIKNLTCKHEITPFTLNDDDGEVNRMSKATGGKQFISRREAIKRAGYVTDVDAELAEIRREEEEEAEATRKMDFI